MGIFDGIGDVTVADRNPSFPDGTYDATLVKLEVTKKNPRGDQYIVVEGLIDGRRYAALKKIDAAYDGLYHKAFLKGVVAAAMGTSPEDPELKEPPSGAARLCEAWGIDPSVCRSLGETPTSMVHLGGLILLAAKTVSIPIQVSTTTKRSPKTGKDYSDTIFHPAGSMPVSAAPKPAAPVTPEPKAPASPPEAKPAWM